MGFATCNGSLSGGQRAERRGANLKDMRWHEALAWEPQTSKLLSAFKGLVPSLLLEKTTEVRKK